MAPFLFAQSELKLPIIEDKNIIRFMRKLIFLTVFCSVTLASMAQLKPRLDAFPPQSDPSETKRVDMATTIDQMDSWDRYPTYEVYLAMMQRYVDSFPQLCHLDTIGTSVQGRLVLCLAITGSEPNDLYRPEFFYSSSMHGDELTGFILMLRLCDTLLGSYGQSADLTQLLNSTRIYINPLANPDGTYHGGNNTVDRAWRYNANMVDLNRNYPDPFGTDPLTAIQQENLDMIAYVEQHQFCLSANLHGGSEVMNYPWDSFTSRQRPNEHAEWWEAVCKRFVDTCRLYDNARFRDVDNSGVIEGGDWYVISNGRQDYFNYYHMREVTMELSSTKTISGNNLPRYWHCMAHSLINYIKEVHNLDEDDTVVVSIPEVAGRQLFLAVPNPTHGPFKVEGERQCYQFDFSDRPAGVYVVRVEGRPVKIIKY